MEEFNILLKCKGSEQVQILAKEIEKVSKFHGKTLDGSAATLKYFKEWENNFYITFDLVSKQLTGYDFYIDYLPQYQLVIEFENRHQLLELTKLPFDEFNKIYIKIWLLECYLNSNGIEIDKVTEILKTMNQYKTYAQYNKEIDHIRKATEQKIFELRKQEQQQIENLKAIPDKNIEIGLKNYNEYSQRNIDLAEFKKMLNENYNTMLMFCFEKSEFQQKEMAEEINIAIC